MTVRFIEYLKIGNKDINLFYVQEKPDESCFSVQIYPPGEDPIVVLMLKEKEKRWKVLPQEAPEWMQSIREDLISILEIRLSKMGN